MNIAFACFAFVLILLIYGFISEVFTVLFRLAGMPEKKARFQVISLLTNSGYTTSESEYVTINDQRRSLAQKTMLFGYVFSVTIVSALVNVLFSMKTAQARELLWSMPAPIILVIAYILLRKNEKVKKWINCRLEEMAARILAKGKESRVLIMDSYGQNVIAQVHLPKLPDTLRGIALKDTHLREKGVNVLLIKRGREAITASGDTILLDGDVVVAFGASQAIEQEMHLTEGMVKMQES